MDFVLLSVIAFFLAATIAFLSLETLVLERHSLYRNLRRVRGLEINSSDIRQKELASPFMQRVAWPTMKSLGRLGKRFSPSSVPERLARELGYAGNPPGWDVERLLAFKVLGGVSLSVMAIAIWFARQVSIPKGLLLLGVFGFLGYYLPDTILRGRWRQRQEQIRRALPDSLDLLSITVEAGLGFDSAMARIAQEIGGPLAQELHRVRQEMQLGLPRTEALRQLGERTTVEELKSFILSMVQADVFGVSIANVLHVQAREMRIKRRQRAEERAQKIPVKIVFPVLFCIFPSLFIVLLGPAGITIYKALFGAY